MKQNSISEIDKKNNFVRSFRIILIISVLVTSMFPICAERTLPNLIFKDIIFSKYHVEGRDTIELDKEMILILSLPEGWKRIYAVDSITRSNYWDEQLTAFYPFVRDSMQLRVKDHGFSHFLIRKTECEDMRYLSYFSPSIDSLISFTHIEEEYIDIQGIIRNEITGEERFIRGITLPKYKLYFTYENVRKEEVGVFNEIFDNIIICNAKKIPIIHKRRKKNLLDKISWWY